MAEDKKSFILYTDNKEMVESLSDEQAGLLFKHIFKYVNDENPEPANQIINIAFIPIKQSLKRDLKKWENKQLQRSEAGKESARLRKVKRNEEQQKATTVKTRSTNPTVSVSVSGSGSVSDIIDKSINTINEHEIVSTFNKITGKKSRLLNCNTRSQISQRLKDGYTLEEIYKAIKNCFDDDYHKKNPQFLTLEFITRPDKLDMWLNSGVKQTKLLKEKTQWA